VLIHCFYCDNPLTLLTAYISAYGKTYCADCRALACTSR